jgi:hypothetical protein
MSELSLKDFDPVKVRAFRSYITAVCPFHDASGVSLFIYQDGFFICRSCGAQGNWRKLWHKYAEVGFLKPDPAKTAAGPGLRLPTERSAQAELCRQAHERLVESPTLGHYLEKRGLDSLALIRQARLGWWRQWITLPVMNAQGLQVGMVMRATDQAKGALRFLTPLGQPALPYTPNWRRLATASVIFVVFGMLDTLTFELLGYPVLTTTAGKDSFDPAWLEAYRKPVYFLEDAGETDSATKRTLHYGLGWRYHHLSFEYPRGSKDPNDLLMHGQTDRLRAVVEPLLQRKGDQ